MVRLKDGNFSDLLVIVIKFASLPKAGSDHKVPGMRGRLCQKNHTRHHDYVGPGTVPFCAAFNHLRPEAIPASLITTIKHFRVKVLHLLPLKYQYCPGTGAPLYDTIAGKSYRGSL